MTVADRLLELTASIHHAGNVPLSLSPVEDPAPIPLTTPLTGREVGCVVLAGGLATRLGSSLPKGVIPFAPGSKKPLLQLIAERVSSYGRRHSVTSRLAIMTSEATDGQIRKFFSHNLFGLDTLEFFIQPSLPLLDMSEQPIFKTDGSPLTGPDGNGSVFQGLMTSQILQRWEQNKIEALTIITVDNPLLDPLCPSLLIPVLNGIDLTAAVIERTDPAEQVGLFAQENDHLRVVEYTEISTADREVRDEQNRLRFRWANISAFGCNPSFIKAAATLHLPIHPAKKMVSGQPIWKGESFIFDAIPAARTARLVPLDRTTSFAPIKDPASFEAAQRRFSISIKV